MKERITKNELKERFIVIDAGHIENLLSRSEADYYTTRAEGWGCDVYLFNTPINYEGVVALCVGNDIVKKHPTQRIWELSRKYDEKARALLKKTRYNRKKYNYVTTILNRWIRDFIKEAIEER